MRRLTRSWTRRRCWRGGDAGHGAARSLGGSRADDAVAAVDERAGQALADGLQFDYQQPGEKPDCRWRIKSERERMLTRVAQDAERGSSRPMVCSSTSRWLRLTGCCGSW